MSLRSLARGTLVASLLLATTLAGASPDFSHGVEEGPRPWTDKNFDRDPGKFTFAIHADITGGERQGIFDISIAQLNLLRPEFIINVGDLISGSDDPAEVNQRWDEFESRVNRARAPLFLVGGNHDADLQLTGVDHLHIDVLVAQHPEKPRTHVGVTAKTDPDNRQLADATFRSQI